MTVGEETDPVLRLVDTVIMDLATGLGRYIGRRAEAGDAASFVLQDGEAGRLRLPRPDLDTPASVLAMTQAAQRYLCTELGEPVPRCPQHPHALGLVATATPPSLS